MIIRLSCNRLLLTLKVGILMLSFLSFPAYADDGDALLKFTMQLGSIMYTLIIVSLFARNKKARTMLLALYLFLTVSGYLFTLNSVFELNMFLTVSIRSIVPLLATMVLTILVRLWRKT